MDQLVENVDRHKDNIALFLFHGVGMGVFAGLAVSLASYLFG